MMFLFTERNAIGSKLIRWGLREDCSHFAVVFDESPDGYHGLVFHSSLMGVKPLWFKEFIDEYTIVHALKPKKEMGLYDEEKIYRSLVDNFCGKSYDWPALGYWIWRILLYKFLSAPIPASNAWKKDGEYLCTGVARCLKNSSNTVLQAALRKIPDMEMISPYRLYLVLRTSPDLEDVPWLPKVLE